MAGWLGVDYTIKWKVRQDVGGRWQYRPNQDQKPCSEPNCLPHTQRHAQAALCTQHAATSCTCTSCSLPKCQHAAACPGTSLRLALPTPATLSARPKSVRAPSQSSCLAAMVASRCRACPLSGSRPRSSCSRLCACREQQQAAVRRQWGCRSCHVRPATVKLQRGASLHLLSQPLTLGCPLLRLHLEGHNTDRHHSILCNRARQPRTGHALCSRAVAARNMANNSLE